MEQPDFVSNYISSLEFGGKKEKKLERK